MFDFKEYRLEDGVVVQPESAGLILRHSYPPSEITKKDILVALYDYNRVPVTFTGRWQENSNDWVFKLKVGLSSDGEETKALIESMQRK